MRDVLFADALLMEKLSELPVLISDPSGSHLHLSGGLDALEFAYSQALL